MRKLILETDSQGNVSVHLHGFKPSIAQDSDAGGELRRSPYGAHAHRQGQTLYLHSAFCKLELLSFQSSAEGQCHRAAVEVGISGRTLCNPGFPFICNAAVSVNGLAKRL